MSERVSRRELLLAAQPAFAQTGGDAAVVAELLALEQLVVRSYEIALETVRREPLPSRFETVLRRFGRQEVRHAEVLASELDALGGRPGEPPADAEALARARAEAGLEHPLDRLGTPAEVGRFGIELENAQIARYLAAVRALRDAKLVALALQVMAAEGQHVAVLRGLLSDDVALVVPEAFERGDAFFP